MNVLSRHRRALRGVVCVVCAGIVAVFYWLGFNLMWWSEFSARDFLTKFGKKSPVREDLVFLAIDQATVSLPDAWPEEIEASPALKAMKNSGWPWSRDVYPMIIERLVDAGARLIVFDLLFPTEREGDSAFRAALERHRDKVVIGTNFVRTTLTTTLTIPSQSLIPSGDPLDPRVGYVNFWPDLDATVRRANYRITEQEVNGMEPAPGSRVLYSLTGRTLSKLDHEDLIPREPRCIRFAEEFQPHSLWQIFTTRTWEAYPYNRGGFFRNKIVLIGPEGDWAKDIIRTPFGEIPGPALHLQALNAALNGDFVRESSRVANLAGILIAGLAAWGLSVLVAQPFFRFLIFIVGSVAYFFFARFLFGLESGAILIGITPPLFAANGSGLVWLVCEQVIDRREKARTRRTLERYVSKDLVKEILA